MCHFRGGNIDYNEGDVVIYSFLFAKSFHVSTISKFKSLG